MILNSKTVLNSFIHDWALPNMDMSHCFVVVGCSHSTGVGNARQDCYVSMLEEHYNIPAYNLAVGNGNSCINLLNLLAIGRFNLRPKFVVAQWPNPVRKIIWDHEHGHLMNINNGNETFHRLLKDSIMNYYLDWSIDVLSSSSMMGYRGIPMVNIFLEHPTEDFINVIHSHIEKIHIDEKIPGRTWLFDNAAGDGMHHSPGCHRQWANRLIPLIDEATSR